MSLTAIRDGDLKTTSVLIHHLKLSIQMRKSPKYDEEQKEAKKSS